MAPFTVAGTGATKAPVVGTEELIAKPVNCVGPWYGGSALLTPWLFGSGCVMVLVGHYTRNDCALAATAAKAMMRMKIQTWYGFLMGVQPPHLDPQTAPATGPGCSYHFGAEFSAVLTSLLARSQIE